MADIPVDVLHAAKRAAQEEQGPRILIVEDSALQQRLLAMQLKQLGYRVDVASDGFDALSAVQAKGYYDVILMDCQMPLMDGLQATRFIREMECRTGHQTAIIGVSATASSKQCFDAGMDDFRTKPLNKLILQAVLGRWAKQKQGCLDSSSQTDR